jgi:hypothetical protein
MGKMTSEQKWYIDMTDRYIRDCLEATLALSNPIRQICNQAYRIEVKLGRIQPIEKAANKEEFWNEALNYDLTRQQRIELAISLYYMASKCGNS